MKKTMTKTSRPEATLKRKLDASSEIMTVSQVAEYLAVHPSTIYRLLKNRQMPVFKLGSDWRFRRSDIEQWISDREVKLVAAGEYESKSRGRQPKSMR